MIFRKTLFTGLVVAGLAAASVALAQGGPSGGMNGTNGMGGSAMGCAGNAQQRAEALKTALGITGEQDAAWSAYAKVLDDNAKTMQADRAGMDRAKIQAMTPEKRQAFMAERMEKHSQLYGKLKAAAEALLPSLTEYQKGKASVILPGLASGMGGGMMGHGMGHGMGMGGGMMGR